MRFIGNFKFKIQSSMNSNYAFEKIFKKRSLNELKLSLYKYF